MIPIQAILWDPKPEIFTLPFLNYPILWYGFLFALGFILGFPIFVAILERFFLENPEFKREDILGECRHPKLADANVQGKGPLLQALNRWLYSQDSIQNTTPEFKPNKYFQKNRLAARRLELEQLFRKGIFSLRAQAATLTDRYIVYLVIATVLGARIGHLVFYETPAYYLHHPLQIIAIWKGGLSSHGAAVAIIVASIIFARRFRPNLRGLTWLGLLDLACVPIALAGALIRIGNFFNQEILGTSTSVPWAIIFGHPADGSCPTPRHPVQLYESLAYGSIFFLLWRLTFISSYLVQRGRLGGLFLMLVFGCRMLIEQWKVEQSAIAPLSSFFTMGQILSFPLFLIGLWLFFRKKSM